jgi:hypothetical protein
MSKISAPFWSNGYLTATPVECGHAWRVAYSFWNTLSGVGAGADTTDKHALKLQNQLDSRYPQPQHIIGHHRRHNKMLIP